MSVIPMHFTRAGTERAGSDTSIIQLDLAPAAGVGAVLDETDRCLIQLTQAGLPLSVQPFHDLAVQLGIDVEQVIARLRRMQDGGMIRRIGAVPNHYALGYRANGMSVWNVQDAHVHRLGRAVGELKFVSHCYLRGRHPPRWPYNLFAMVHGRGRDEVEQGVEKIRALLGNRQSGHRVLYSTRILKKTGLRLSDHARRPNPEG